MNRYQRLKQRRDELTAQRNALLDAVDALLVPAEGEAAGETRAITDEVRSQITAKQAKAAELLRDIQLVQQQMDAHGESEESRGVVAGRPNGDSREAVEPEAEAEAPASRARVESVPEERIPGINAARYCMLLGRAQLAMRSGQPVAASQLARDQYGENHPVTRALGVSNFENGGALLGEFSQEIIELLRPASVFDQLGPTPGSIINGKLSAPKVSAGGSAFWMEEGGQVQQTSTSFGQVGEAQRKIGCMLVMNNEWLRFPTRQYEQMVRDDLVASIAQAKDIAFIRSDGTAGEPKGLRYWAASANLIPFNATVNLANTRTDLGKMTLKLHTQKKGRVIRPAWIYGPSAIEYLENLADGNGNLVYAAQIASGQIKRRPFQVCDQLPEDLGGGGDESEIYLVDMADIVAAMSEEIRVETSSEASYTSGSAQVSAWEHDQTVLRVITYAALIARRAESIVVGTAVKWTP
ncbi:MAG TPA: phage major capsid protein [Thermoanaerobaculia bacterium]|nr:phage major capsid protein [Thermoanaerobaculia bacterium]